MRLLERGRPPRGQHCRDKQAELPSGLQKQGSRVRVRGRHPKVVALGSRVKQGWKRVAKAKTVDTSTQALGRSGTHEDGQRRERQRGRQLGTMWVCPVKGCPHTRCWLHLLVPTVCKLLGNRNLLAFQSKCYVAYFSVSCSLLFCASFRRRLSQNMLLFCERLCCLLSRLCVLE